MTVMIYFVSFVFAALNCFLLFFSRRQFDKSSKGWLVPLLVLFAYFFAKILLHKESALLACIGTQASREFFSDVLVEPMIVLWSVILGAVFFSGRPEKGSNRTTYIVSVVNQEQDHN